MLCTILLVLYISSLTLNYCQYQLIVTQQFSIMSYQMKKALRKTAGMKSYAQLQEENDINAIAWQLKEHEKELQKQSIFENKNWTLKQKVKLMIFLSYYHGLPDWLSQRRSIHLYKHLSNFLKKTRTPEQCKNIHSLLKRKFPTLQSVLRAMMAELCHDAAYEKLVNKYQKEIQKFQQQNSLLDYIDRQGYEPLISCYLVNTTKERKGLQTRGRVIVNDDDLKFNLNEYIKFQQKNELGESKNREDQLAMIMQFHFQEWIKCMCIVQQLNEKSQQKIQS